MKEPERRQTTRTTIRGLAYINFEANNGGIVLNVSEGGLCFRSVTTVQGNGPIRFWFSEYKHRIEADGELVWVDETLKTGGLRFTALPAEGREQIRSWISQPTMRRGADEASARTILPPRPSPPLSGSLPDTNASPNRAAPLAVNLLEVKLPTPKIGFSRGLATGLLVSALVAVPILFHAYRGQFGDSLIHLGERLAAKSQAQTQTVSPVPQTLLPTLRPSSPANAPIPVSPPKLLPQPPTNPARPQQAKLGPTRPAAAGPIFANGPAHGTPAAAGAATIPSTTPAISFPTTAVAPNSGIIPDRIGAIPEHEPTSHLSVHAETSRGANAGSNSEGYFEIGKFKDNLAAHKVMDKLAQLGFHSTFIQKGHLWMNSFYVLVGPYGEEENAEAARGNLVSHGFKPRAFERGSRDFTFRPGLTLNGMRVPVGDCIIRWESYSPDATLKFVQDDYVVFTADGKWVKRDITYQNDAYVYRTNGDGSRTLLEIRFAGMSKALVFGRSS